MSIHAERFSYPYDKQRKKNTCAKPDKEVAARKIAAIEGHLANHPRDECSRQHLNAIKKKVGL